MQKLYTETAEMMFCYRFQHTSDATYFDVPGGKISNILPSPNRDEYSNYNYKTIYHYFHIKLSAVFKS